MLHLVAEFYRTPWALDPTTHATVEAVLTRWASGDRLNAAQIQAAVGSAPQATAQRRDAAAQMGGGQVAVIPVYGVLTHRAVDADASSTPLASSIRPASSRSRGPCTHLREVITATPLRRQGREGLCQRTPVGALGNARLARAEQLDDQFALRVEGFPTAGGLSAAISPSPS